MTATPSTAQPAPRLCRCCHRESVPDRGRLCPACDTDMKTWVAAYASERLRKAQSAGLLSTMWNVYLEERLQLEHPTAWFDDWKREAADTDPVRHPLEADLDALEQAQRDLGPSVELRFLHLKHVHRNRCEDTSHAAGRTCPRIDYHGPVLIATYLGTQIARRLRSGQ